MKERGDLIISGMGKMNGGSFNNVEISGTGKVFGDVEAGHIKISGVGRVEGNVRTGKLNAEGSCSIDGSIESDTIDNSGNIKIKGDLKAATVTNSGRFIAKGAIKAQTVRSEGYITADGDFEADEFISDGAFKVGGLLNANNIDVKVRWYSFAREIGGEKIYVRHSKVNAVNYFILTMFGKENVFETELAEGTEISLEYTKAGIVRGNNIKIGTKCEIDLVEYSGSLEIDPDAIVRKQVKI